MDAFGVVAPLAASRCSNTKRTEVEDDGSYGQAGPRPRTHTEQLGKSARTVGVGLDRQLRPPLALDAGNEVELDTAARFREQLRGGAIVRRANEVGRRQTTQ